MSSPDTEKTVTEEPGKTEENTGPLPSNQSDDGGATTELFPGSSNWFNTGSSWLNSAKQKTMNTFDMMKKDLSEFKDVMSTEVAELTTAAKGGLDSTVSVVKQQAEYIEKLVTPEEEEADLPGDARDEQEVDANSEQEKKPVEKSASMGFGWMKSIVDSVTDTVKNLAMEETYEGEDEFTETIKQRAGRKTKISPTKLHDIQTSEATFLNSPEDEEAFNSWMTRFNMEEYDGEINLLLTNNPPLRLLYTKLVPSSVDPVQFWSRYFFAVEVAEVDEEMNESFTLQQLTVKTDGKQMKAKKASDDEINKESPSSDTSSLAVVEQPTSPAKSDDWSVCSEKNDVEEVCSTQSEEETGPLTPRAKDSNEKDGVNEKKEEGWVDWDE